MKGLCRGLLRITRRVVRDAHAVAARLPARLRPRMRGLAARLTATIGIMDRVVAQTRARVLRGDTHYPDKVVSVFEPHTQIIRKGKLAKPTEFGCVVKIQEDEGQAITAHRARAAGECGRH